MKTIVNQFKEDFKNKYSYVYFEDHVTDVQINDFIEKYIKVNNHQEFELMKDYKPQMYENMLNNFQDWVLSQSLCDVVE